jgi:hypothetical protein
MRHTLMVIFVVCLSALATAAVVGCKTSDTPGGGSNSPGGGMMNGASPSSSPGGGMMNGASPSSSSGGGTMIHGDWGAHGSSSAAVQET